MSEAHNVGSYLLDQVRKDIAGCPGLKLTFTKMDYQGGSIGLLVSFGIKEVEE